MFPRDGANWANWWKFNAEGLARKGEVKLDPRSPEYAEIRSKFVNVSELVDFGLGYPRRGGMELNRLGDDESTRAVPCTGTQGSSTRNGSRGRTSLRSLSLSLVGHPCVTTTPLLFLENSYANKDMVLHCGWINPKGRSVAESTSDPPSWSTCRDVGVRPPTTLKDLAW